MIQVSAEHMWDELASFQRYASMRGYGEAWEKMLTSRSQDDCDKASDAAWLFAVSYSDESSKNAWEAADCAFDSLGTTIDEVAKQAHRKSALSWIHKAIEKHDSKRLMLRFIGQLD